MRMSLRFSFLLNGKNNAFKEDRSDNLWTKLCKTLGLDELIEDPRFKEPFSRLVNRSELEKELEEVLQTKSNEYWL